MQNMERYGRNGDTAMAHLTPGETVVPQQLLQQNPQVARGLGLAFQDAGADPTRYVVGSGNNSINPMTGQPEFFFKELAAIGAKLLANPSVQGALGNAALRKVQGKDVGLRDLLLGGATGAGLGAFTGKGTPPFLANLMGGDVDSGIATRRNPIAGVPDQISTPADALKEAVNNSVSKKPPKYKDGLLGIGSMLGLDPSSGFGKFLNNKAGEGIFTGLGAQLMDSLFSKDEDPDPYDPMERFNRGSGEAPIVFAERPMRDRSQDSVIMRNEGGPAYFPRRNGGIMPSEGSGTKDDVPAMLTAGEFVMTRDAVKGAGGGDLNSGINKMYGMMDNLERKVG